MVAFLNIFLSVLPLSWKIFIHYDRYSEIEVIFRDKDKLFVKVCIFRLASLLLVDFFLFVAIWKTANLSFASLNLKTQNIMKRRKIIIHLNLFKLLIDDSINSDKSNITNFITPSNKQYIFFKYFHKCANIKFLIPISNHKLLLITFAVENLK